MECQEGTAKCDDLCDNIKGGYVCKCLESGMKLSADGFSCEKIRSLKPTYGLAPPTTISAVSVNKVERNCDLGYKK